MTGLILSLTKYLIIYFVVHDTTLHCHCLATALGVLVWRDNERKQGLETNQGTAALHYGIAWNGYGLEIYLHYTTIFFDSRGWDMVGGKIGKHLGIFLVVDIGFRSRVL